MLSSFAAAFPELRCDVPFSQTTCMLVLMGFYGFTWLEAAELVQQHPGAELQRFDGQAMWEVLTALDPDERNFACLFEDFC